MYLCMFVFTKDQYIICLMQQYEINGVDTSEFRYVSKRLTRCTVTLYIL